MHGKSAVPTTEAHNEGADGDLASLAGSGTVDDPKATAIRKTKAHKEGANEAPNKG